MEYCSWTFVEVTEKVSSFIRLVTKTQGSLTQSGSDCLLSFCDAARSNSVGPKNSKTSSSPGTDQMSLDRSTHRESTTT